MEDSTSKCTHECGIGITHSCGIGITHDGDVFVNVDDGGSLCPQGELAVSNVGQCPCRQVGDDSLCAPCELAVSNVRQCPPSGIVNSMHIVIDNYKPHTSSQPSTPNAGHPNDQQPNDGQQRDGQLHDELTPPTVNINQSGGLHQEVNHCQHVAMSDNVAMSDYNLSSPPTESYGCPTGDVFMCGCYEKCLRFFKCLNDVR